MSFADIFMAQFRSIPWLPGRWLAEGLHRLRALRERHRSAEAISEARGVTLLREWLSPAQKAQFEASRSFDVVGCHTGRRYRISLRRGTNVHEVDETGRPVIGWCFVPAGGLVPGDVVLAQKIALETDEWRALALANRFPVHVPS
jgi:hypothetical protein